MLHRRALLVFLFWAPLAAAQTTGLLAVDSQPERAAVYLDGVLYGRTPFQTLLAPGTYRLRLEANGRDPVEQSITIEALGTQRLSLVLPATGRTRIVVADAPPDARVWVNGAPVAADVRLPEGPARVEVVLPDGRRYARRLRLSSRSLTTLHLVDGQVVPARVAQAFVPGLLAWRSGQRVLAVGIVAAVATGLGVGVDAGRRAHQLDGDLDAAYVAYLAAQSEAEAVARYATVDALADQRDDILRQQRAGHALAAGVAAAAVAEALLRRTRVAGLRVVPSDAVSARGIGAGPSVRLAFAF